MKFIWDEKRCTSKGSQTDWERISKMEDKDINFSEIPELTEGKIVRMGFPPVRIEILTSKIRS